MERENYIMPWLREASKIYNNCDSNFVTAQINEGHLNLGELGELVAVSRYGGVRPKVRNNKGYDIFFTKPIPELYYRPLVEVKTITLNETYYNSRYPHISRLQATVNGIKNKKGKKVTLILYIFNPFEEMVSEYVIPWQEWEARAGNTLAIRVNKNDPDWWAEFRTWTF